MYTFNGENNEKQHKLVQIMKQKKFTVLLLDFIFINSVFKFNRKLPTFAIISSVILTMAYANVSLSKSWPSG